MIKITNKQKCCGCAACVQVCPKRCISMKEDEEGFLYPEADAAECIDCGLCDKVCPEINQGNKRVPLKAFAAKNKDEKVRMQSSSGGVFTLLAEKVIDEGGVVFGAGFDKNWEVVHSYTDTKEGLSAFRGSKYVQSRIEDNFQKAEEFLKEGRKVLFSGTPCQIAGLKLYLQKEYSNLLTVDFICHGVPSPRVWRDYFREEVIRHCNQQSAAMSALLQDKGMSVSGVFFRDKMLGWRNYCMAFALSVPALEWAGNHVMRSGPLDRDMFLRGYRANLFLRPSCHACPVKSLKSGSDVTLADFWGIEKVLPEMDDNKGTSLVILNSGAISLEDFADKLEFAQVKFEDAVWNNKYIFRSVAEPRKRSLFFSIKGKTVATRVLHLTRNTYLALIKLIIKKIIMKLSGRRF